VKEIKMDIVAWTVVAVGLLSMMIIAFLLI